ncbi:MAG: CheR family methyltransferase [Chloroflexota bacterium]
MSTAAFDQALLGDCSRAIAQRTGLNFPSERWPDLERGICAAASTLALGSPVVLARRIVAGDLAPRERQVLIDRLTVGETYFRREPAAFEALEQEVLPRLLAARAGTTRSLRLWSAGCCTGEEAYSLAMSCIRTVEDLGTWKVSVLGTDVNEHAIAKARRGTYGPWSFRGTPDWLQPRHFIHDAGRTWEIGAGERALVRFATHNLAADPFPPDGTDTGAMDVIFCRNVVMYLTQEHQREVFALFHSVLADDGVLVLSPAEGGLQLRDWFELEMTGDAMLYRKAGHATRQTPAGDRHLSPAPHVRRATRAHRSHPVATPARPITAPAPAPAPAALAAIVDAPGPAPAPLAATVDAPAPVAAISTVISPAQAAGDLLARARARADQGHVADAIPLCEEALTLDPACSRAAYLLATVHQDLGNHDEEAAALRRTLEIDDGFVLAHRGLGDLARRRGRPAEARRHFGRALVALSAMDRVDVVPESDGITAGRLAEAITRMLHA